MQMYIVLGLSLSLKGFRCTIMKHMLHTFIYNFYLLLICYILQIAVWRVLHESSDADVLATKKALLILILLQWIPRFWRFLPLISEMKKTVGVVTESAWAGAAYYLLWFVLASHVSSFYGLGMGLLKDLCFEGPNFFMFGYFCSNIRSLGQIFVHLIQNVQRQGLWILSNSQVNKIILRKAFIFILL